MSRLDQLYKRSIMTKLVANGWSRVLQMFVPKIWPAQFRPLCIDFSGAGDQGVVNSAVAWPVLTEQYYLDSTYANHIRPLTQPLVPSPSADLPRTSHTTGGGSGVTSPGSLCPPVTCTNLLWLSVRQYSTSPGDSSDTTISGSSGRGGGTALWRSNPNAVREDTVFLKGLPSNIDLDSLEAEFGALGPIKLNNNTRRPMIWIFKENGQATGEALVSYEDPSTAQAAIKHFKSKEFMGQPIEIALATNSQRPQLQQSNAMGRDGYRGGRQWNTDPNAVRVDTVLLKGLPPNVDFTALEAEFGALGQIKSSAKTGMPMIWIFRDQGQATGEALVTYEDPNTAQAAIKHFQSQQFMGQMIDINLATNSKRPRLQQQQQQQSGGNFFSRAGDWYCNECGNNNFAWRQTCNRCQAPNTGGSGKRGRDGFGKSSARGQDGGGTGRGRQEFD